jgi:hypothetical protein
LSRGQVTFTQGNGLGLFVDVSRLVPRRRDERDRNESDEVLVRALEDGIQPPVAAQPGKGPFNQGGNTMEAFLSKHAHAVTGTLSEFDRLVFRGTLRMLAHCGGMMSYLHAVKVLLKDFASRAEAMTKRLREASDVSTRHNVFCQHSRQTNRNEYFRSGSNTSPR